jgi:GMP synthase-like glutamine amidotransferase
MGVLAFRHVPFEGLGAIAPALERAGLEFRYVDSWANAVPEELSQPLHGLVFMGGPMSVNDDLPSLRREEDLIRHAARSGVPILGVCLGAQLIAEALGANVRRNPVKEIGWAPVWWTEAGRQDPLFKGLAEPEILFHWHGETFDLPPGAELLAYSAACRHQAFRIGSNVYGLQFHLEVTPDIIEDWCTEDANCGDMRELESPIEPRAHSERLAEIAAIVLDRWTRMLVSTFGQKDPAAHRAAGRSCKAGSPAPSENPAAQ